MIRLATVPPLPLRLLKEPAVSPFPRRNKFRPVGTVLRFSLCNLSWSRASICDLKDCLTMFCSFKSGFSNKGLKILDEVFELGPGYSLRSRLRAGLPSTISVRSTGAPSFASPIVKGFVDKPGFSFFSYNISEFLLSRLDFDAFSNAINAFALYF